MFNSKDAKTIKGNVLIENNIITKFSTEGSPNRLMQDEMRKGTDIAIYLMPNYTKP